MCQKKTPNHHMPSVTAKLKFLPLCLTCSSEFSKHLRFLSLILTFTPPELARIPEVILAYLLSLITARQTDTERMFIERFKRTYREEVFDFYIF